MTLASYSFVTQFQPGIRNTKADAPSRREHMAFDTNDPCAKQPVLELLQPGQLVLAPLINHSVDLGQLLRNRINNAAAQDKAATRIIDMLHKR